LIVDEYDKNDPYQGKSQNSIRGLIFLGKIEENFSLDCVMICSSKKEEDGRSAIRQAGNIYCSL
jgi:hypothetical protein